MNMVKNGRKLCKLSNFLNILDFLNFQLKIDLKALRKLLNFHTLKNGTHQ